MGLLDKWFSNSNHSSKQNIKMNSHTPKPALVKREGSLYFSEIFFGTSSPVNSTRNTMKNEERSSRKPIPNTQKRKGSLNFFELFHIFKGSTFNRENYPKTEIQQQETASKTTTTTTTIGIRAFEDLEIPFCDEPEEMEPLPNHIYYPKTCTPRRKVIIDSRQYSNFSNRSDTTASVTDSVHDSIFDGKTITSSDYVSTVCSSAASTFGRRSFLFEKLDDAQSLDSDTNSNFEEVESIHGEHA
ncbi:hypothetical protein G9A89_002178 [Geosiphon pyriformis]|nr:hypothetical protein G9A89_002178 [Geosiphon pyriformis]